MLRIIALIAELFTLGFLLIGAFEEPLCYWLALASGIVALATELWMKWLRILGDGD